MKKLIFYFFLGHFFLGEVTPSIAKPTAFKNVIVRIHNSDTIYVAPPTGERNSILAALDLVQPDGTIQFATGTYLVIKGISVKVPDKKLHFTPCPFTLEDSLKERVQCGYFSVPEDRWDKENDKSIRLAFAVIKAVNPDKNATPLIILTGGPGAHALPEWLSRVKSFANKRDVIVYDQRGTGYSEPKMCPSLKQTFIEIESQDLDKKEAEPLKKEAVINCRDELLARNIDLGAYNTRSSAADFNELRLALGYEQVNLFSFSYGTRLAQTVIRYYPEGVKSVIFGGPSPVHRFNYSKVVPYYYHALEQVFSACANRQQCNLEFPDLKEKFYSIYDNLHQDPWTIKVDSAVVSSGSYTVNAVDYINIMHMLLYRENTIPLYPRVIQAFYNREEENIRALIEKYYGGSNKWSYGMQFSVDCYDLESADAWLKWQQQSSKHPAPLSSPGYWNFPCDNWHQERAGESERLPVKSSVPALIISGTFDPITPPSGGDEIARNFANSHHITIPAGAHQPGQSFPCISEIINSFLVNPKEASSRECIKNLPKLEFKTTLTE